MSIWEVNDITAHWGLHVKEYTELSESTYMLNTIHNEKYILKKKDSKEVMERELKLLRHLKADRVPTLYPLLNRSGEMLVSHQGNYYVVYNFLDGKPFSPKEIMNHSAVPGLLGETIAELHKSLATLEAPEYLPKRDLYQVLSDWAVKEIHKHDSGNQVLTCIFNELKGELKNKIGHLPVQIIHRDAHLYNLIYKDNKLSGIIDFDIAEVNVRIFDLCYCCTSILSENYLQEHLREKWILFAQELIANYHAKNPLNETELESIWLIMLSIQAIFMAFFIGNDPVYLINRNMFIWLYENKGALHINVTR